MQKNNFYQLIARCLTFSLLLLFSPQISHSAQLFHTIQIGSFIKIAPAQKQFDSVVEKLNEEELDNLRIEKIGKFYSVRLGKFNDSAAAKKFLQVIKPRLSKATVMDAYIKEKRIKKLYSSSSTAKEKIVQENPSSNPLPEIPKPELTNNIYKLQKKLPLKDKIAAVANLVGKKDYTSALVIIKEAIAAHPENADLHAWFGIVYLKMDRPSEAFEYLIKATELSPDVSDYHNGLGYSLLFLNMFDQAIDEFNKAIDLDPVHFDALTGLCISYAKKGKKEKALDIYNKLIGLDKKIPDDLLKIIKQTT